MDTRHDDARGFHPQGYFSSLTAIDRICLKICSSSKRKQWTLKSALGLGGVILPAVILAGSAATAAEPATVVSQADFATVTRFEARLDSADSASEILRQWCADRGLAKPPIIRAVRLDNAERPASTMTRGRLGAGPRERLRYRHVQLVCGAHVLSEADNWYRPSLLSAEMNRRLDETDTPFGLAVAALTFRRESVSVNWLVKPAARATGPAGAPPMPKYLLRHTAILRTGEGVPFSLVIETYTSAILANERSGDAPLSP